MISGSCERLEYSLFREAADGLSLNDPSLDGALSFQAFGLPIGIRANHAGVVPRLIEHLPPDAQPTSARPECLYTLHIGVSPRRARSRKSESVLEQNPGPETSHLMLAHSTELAEVLEIFESDLQLQVAVMCDDKVFVHAGVAGWKGRAIVVPGRSTSGKTSLIAALVRAGATYYSDEYAVLDENGRVHPYARPLRIRTGGISRLHCEPEMLGGMRGVKPLPMGLIVVTRYRAGAEWKPRRLSAGKALLALIDNTVAVRRSPRECLTMLRQSMLCRNMGAVAVIESARGEAEDVAPLILQEMDAQSRENGSANA